MQVQQLFGCRKHLCPSLGDTVFTAENGNRSSGHTTSRHHRPTLGRVQLTVAFQRLCTSAPAAPLLSSGLAGGSSEKPALEAYLQEQNTAGEPRLVPRCPLGATASPARARAARGGLLLHGCSPSSGLQLKGTPLSSCRGEAERPLVPGMEGWKGSVGYPRAVSAAWAGQEMLVRDTNRATATLPLCKQQGAALRPGEAPLNPTINRELKRG